MKISTCPLVAVALMVGMMYGGIARGADTVTYYHIDSLGTPVMESNAAGFVTYAREHRPFGQQALGANKYSPGFTGHIADADTELTYMQARYYDPVAARFLSNDPISADPINGGNYNRYWYANNNPYRFVDPDGRKVKPSTLCDWAGGCDGGGQTRDGDSQAEDRGSNGESRWEHWKSRLGLSGDLTKNGNIFDLESLLYDVIPPFLDSPEGVGFKLAGAGLFAVRTEQIVRATRVANLPGWRKLTVDMTHIAERHMVGGAYTEGRTVFIGLTEKGVLATIKQAYGASRVVKQQGDRVLLSGVSKTGMTVEMWLNKATNTIETAYPVVGR